MHNGGALGRLEQDDDLHKPPLNREALLLGVSAPLLLILGGLAIAGASCRPAIDAAALKRNGGRAIEDDY